MQNRTGDEMGFSAKKLQRHQRTGAVRKHICRSANVFDHGLQVGGLSGKIIAAVCRFAAATTAAAVVGNDAVVTGELAGDTVKKTPSTQAPCTHTKAGVSGDTSGPAYSRQAIVVPAFSTVKSMLCPHHQCSSSCTSARLDGPALLYALLTD